MIVIFEVNVPIYPVESKVPQEKFMNCHIMHVINWIGYRRKIIRETNAVQGKQIDSYDLNAETVIKFEFSAL